jgi:hypothetical protein
MASVLPAGRIGALLELITACDAEGHRAEADRIPRRILANHDAEIEGNLLPRTAQFPRRRRWIDQASQPIP